jgi:hypothetical protein
MHKNQTQQKTKLATFTYCGKEVRRMTMILKTRQQISFCTRNTINNTLKHRKPTEKYNNSNFYQMKCLDCPLKYIGQTEKTFNIIYKEHIQAIGNDNRNSGYSNYILNTGHTYGTVADTMNIIKMERKSRHLNTSGKYCIYKISRSKLHMNDSHIDTTQYSKHCMKLSIGSSTRSTLEDI